MSRFDQVFQQLVMPLEFARLNRVVQRFHQTIGVLLFEFFQSRDGDPCDSGFCESDNLLQSAELTTADQADRLATLPGSARSADSVDIIFGIVGQLVVEDDFKIVDVESPCCHVGRDEQFDFSFAKSLHHTFTHDLSHVAMKLVGGITTSYQRFGELVDLNLGESENQAIANVVQIQQSTKNFGFRTEVNFRIGLFNRRNVQCGRFDPNCHRIAGKPLNDLADRWRNRCGKQDRLAFGWDCFQDLFDVIPEAHVEHPVGFVEHDHFHLIELQGPLIDVVNQAPWGSNDDLRSRLQPTKLVLVALATEDR